MLQDRLLEAAQLDPGLDPKLIHKSPPAVAIARQCVCLSPAPVESRHQLPEDALIEGLGRDGAFQVGNELAVVAERESHVDAFRSGGAARIIEPRRCQAGLSLECDAGQRVTPPQGERLIERLQRIVEAICGDGRPRGADELEEACRVQLAGFAVDGVPGRVRRDDLCVAKRAAETRYVLVHHVPCTGRVRLAPDRVDQGVD